MDAAAIDEAVTRLERAQEPSEDEPFDLEVPDAPSDDEHTRRGALVAARDIELMHRRQDVAAVHRLDHIDLLPPQVVDPDSGRPQLTPGQPLVLLGRYLRRARLLCGKTQQRVADEAGVSQSMVSRASGQSRRACHSTVSSPCAGRSIACFPLASARTTTNVPGSR